MQEFEKRKGIYASLHQVSKHNGALDNLQLSSECQKRCEIGAGFFCSETLLFTLCKGDLLEQFHEKGGENCKSSLIVCRVITGSNSHFCRQFPNHHHQASFDYRSSISKAAIISRTKHLLRELKEKSPTNLHIVVEIVLFLRPSKNNHDHNIDHLGMYF